MGGDGAGPYEGPEHYVSACLCVPTLRTWHPQCPGLWTVNREGKGFGTLEMCGVRVGDGSPLPSSPGRGTLLICPPPPHALASHLTNFCRVWDGEPGQGCTLSFPSAPPSFHFLLLHFPELSVFPNIPGQDQGAPHSAFAQSRL